MGHKGAVKLRPKYIGAERPRNEMPIYLSNELCNDSQKSVANGKFIMTYVGLCHLSEMYHTQKCYRSWLYFCFSIS